MKFVSAAFVIAVLACQCQAQSVITIPASARIYVDASTGFETYLAAAIRDQRVPLTVTADKEAADYELEALSGARRIPASGWAVLWGRGSDQAAMRLVDLHTGEIVFVYTLEHSKIGYDPRTTAEACAKRLRFGMNPASIPVKDKQASPNPALDF